MQNNHKSAQALNSGKMARGLNKEHSAKLACIWCWKFSNLTKEIRNVEMSVPEGSNHVVILFFTNSSLFFSET